MIPPNIIDEEAPTDLLKFGNNAANDAYTLRCKEAGIKLHPARFVACGIGFQPVRPNEPPHELMTKRSTTPAFLTAVIGNHATTGLAPVER